MNPKYFVILGIAVAAGLCLAVPAGARLSLADNSTGKGGNNTQSAVNAVDRADGAVSHHIVKAGGGGRVAPITRFMPTRLEIKQGETVTWRNPTRVAEPHTVSFILDNNTAADVFAPFAVANSTQFASVPPNANSAPLAVPGPSGSKIVVAANSRVLAGAVIDSNGNVTMLGPDASYEMKGTEKYVNSGTILPKGDENEIPGSGNTFSVKFDKAGTYDYICLFHDWMKGRIVVVK
jgi:plastocyanin